MVLVAGAVVLRCRRPRINEAHQCVSSTTGEHCAIWREADVEHRIGVAWRCNGGEKR